MSTVISEFWRATMIRLLLMLLMGAVACQRPRVSNLNDACLACLCSLYNCPLYRGCTSDNCGPFYISRKFWEYVGKPTLPDDDPERNNAYSDCARNYECASKAIANYMGIHGQDCNRDGVTDCFDYTMIIQNGGTNCSPPLFKTANGRTTLMKYNRCQLN